MLIYLTGNKDLLSEFYTDNLNNVQEKLISAMYEEIFFGSTEEHEVRKIDIEESLYKELDSMCCKLDIVCAEDIIYRMIYDFIGIEEQAHSTFKERIELMKRYKKLLGNRLR